jgi:hypothetical protein
MKLIKMWATTLVIMLIAIFLISCGYIFDDLQMFLIGDLIFFPFFCFCYLAYRKEYYGNVYNVRNFK